MRRSTMQSITWLRRAGWLGVVAAMGLASPTLRADEGAAEPAGLAAPVAPAEPAAPPKPVAAAEPAPAPRAPRAARRAINLRVPKFRLDVHLQPVPKAL